MDCRLAQASLSMAVPRNMAVYKKSHKEVYNLCQSHFTSGTNSKEARMNAHSYGKVLIMVATKLKGAWHESKYATEII